MQLRPHELEAIRTAVHDVFGETATVRLFGSRMRDDLTAPAEQGESPRTR
jgi:hypothetical protein